MITEIDGRDWHIKVNGATCKHLFDHSDSETFNPTEAGSWDNGLTVRPLREGDRVTFELLG